MASLNLNVSTVIVLAVIAVLAFLSARRMFRKGTCDCHKDNPRGGKGSGNTGCSGCSCSSCASCPSIEAMNKHLNSFVEKK